MARTVSFTNFTRVLTRFTCSDFGLNVSPRGFWLWVSDREHFLGFEDFPWIRSATIDQVCNVTKVSEGHLYSPVLDVDLDPASIEHPEQFPLKAAH